MTQLNRGLFASLVAALFSSYLSLHTFYNSISSVLSQNMLNLGPSATPFHYLYPSSQMLVPKTLVSIRQEFLHLLIILDLLLSMTPKCLLAIST